MITKVLRWRMVYNYSRPGRVWQVTSPLGTGKWLTFFYSVDDNQSATLQNGLLYKQLYKAAKKFWKTFQSQASRNYLQVVKYPDADPRDPGLEYEVAGSGYETFAPPFGCMWSHKVAYGQCRLPAENSAAERKKDSKIQKKITFCQQVRHSSGHGSLFSLLEEYWIRTR